MIHTGSFIEVSRQQLTQLVRELSPRRLQLATGTDDDRVRLLSDRESIEFPARQPPREVCRDQEDRQRRKGFKFATLESITDRDWNLMFREAARYAGKVLARNRKDGTLADAVAIKVIRSVRDGQSNWQPAESPNVLLYIFGIIRFSAPEIADGIESPGRRARRQIRRGSGKLKQISARMDVQDVIQHLPTIALLVGRLNDLLNPVGNPPELTGGDE